MAYRETRYKRITASGGGTLQAPAYEAYRVRDIFSVASSNDTYLTMDVGGRQVLKLRNAGKSGSHVNYPADKVGQLYEAGGINLMAYLAARGFDMSIPVPAGYTLTVSRYAETGDVTLVYDVYDAGDVKADEPNGPDCLINRYIHYMTNASAIAASPATFDTSYMWTGGDPWPVGGVAVADKVKITVRALIGSGVARGNNTANKGYTAYLQLWYNGDVIGDAQDQNGIPMGGIAATTADADTYGGQASVIGPLTGAQPKPPLILEPPLVFPAGAIVTPKVTVSGAASGGIGAAGLDLALAIERVRAA